MSSFFNDNSNQADCKRKYDEAGHQADIGHELLGGAAAFEAMKMYENKCAKEGRPDNHAMAKQIAAGLAGAMVDRLIETKGLDMVDREKAKHAARKQCEEIIVEREQFDM